MPEVRGALEGHMLDDVGHSELVVCFENRARIHHEAEPSSARFSGFEFLRM